MVAALNTMHRRFDSPLSVMVSDIRDQYAEALSVLLEPHGFTIRRISSGDEAIWLAERRAVDAAVLENDLPDMPGVRALRAIRALDPRMPIILVGTADEAAPADTEHLLLTALKLEAFSVLAAPVDLEVLLGQMARLFELFLGQAGGGGGPRTRGRSRPDETLRFRDADE